MGDPDLGITAVELPRARVLPETGTRRHRSLIGTSGVLLFVCMFLPAVKGCEHSIVPFELPPFIPPYLYGLVFAVLALSRSRRGLAIGTLALRMLAVVVTIAGFAMILIVPPVGAIEMSIGLGLLATIGTGAVSEARVAATAAVLGAVCTVWFALWATTPDALVGVYLSLASSVALLAGGLVWVIEVLIGPASIPRAILRR